jgi:hypothetical protein
MKCTNTIQAQYLLRILTISLVVLAVALASCKKNCMQEQIQSNAWYQDNKKIVIAVDSSKYSIEPGSNRVFIYEEIWNDCSGGKGEVTETFFFERPMNERGFACLLDWAACSFYYQQRCDCDFTKIKIVTSGRIQAARMESPPAAINTFGGSFSFKIPAPYQAINPDDATTFFRQPEFRLR